MHFNFVGTKTKDIDTHLPKGYSKSAMYFELTPPSLPYKYCSWVRGYKNYIFSSHCLVFVKEEGRPVSVWAPTKHLRWANNSLSVAPATLAFLQDYTGIKDPTPKLDMVLVPRFQGALENWGVVSFMYVFGLFV